MPISFEAIGKILYKRRKNIGPYFNQPQIILPNPQQTFSIWAFRPLYHICHPKATQEVKQQKKNCYRPGYASQF